MIDRIKYIVNILIVALLLGAVAINRDASLVGYSLGESEQEVEAVQSENETVEQDGTRVINTTTLGKDITGYAGRTPLLLYVKDDVIKKVETLENNETPSFFRDVLRSGLLDRWQGVTLLDAQTMSVDAVSGATYSSSAIIGNVLVGVEYAMNVNSVSGGSAFRGLGAKGLPGVIVILLGVCITLFRPKRKIFSTVQMVLNVGVLGLWCGSFLSLSQFVSWMSNGFNFSFGIVTILLLAVVIIMPLLGRKGSYCHIHCPMGSAQELVGKIPTRKWRIGSKTTKVLNKVRYYILLALMLLMWTGVGFELMDYEVFSAFLLGSASWVVLSMAIVFLVLSLFVKRPYCRFVCPTGALLTSAERTKL